METIKRRLKEVGGMSHTTDPPRVVDNAVARLNTPLRRHVQVYGEITQTSRPLYMISIVLSSLIFTLRCCVTFLEDSFVKSSGHYWYLLSITF